MFFIYILFINHNKLLNIILPRLKDLIMGNLSLTKYNYLTHRGVFDFYFLQVPRWLQTTIVMRYFHLLQFTQAYSFDLEHIFLISPKEKLYWNLKITMRISAIRQLKHREMQMSLTVSWKLINIYFKCWFQNFLLCLRKPESF